MFESIQVKEVFQTTDNKVFGTKEEAGDHQRCLNTAKAIADILEVELRRSDAESVANEMVFTDVGPRINDLLTKLFK